MEQILKLIEDRNKLRKESDVEGYRKVRDQITNKFVQTRNREMGKEEAEQIEEDIRRGKVTKHTSKLRILRANKDANPQQARKTRQYVGG